MTRESVLKVVFLFLFFSLCRLVVSFSYCLLLVGCFAYVCAFLYDLFDRCCCTLSINAILITTATAPNLLLNCSTTKKSYKNKHKINTTTHKNWSWTVSWLRCVNVLGGYGCAWYTVQKINANTVGRHPLLPFRVVLSLCLVGVLLLIM